MKKNIFSKLITCLVILSCVFVASACDDSKNVKSFSIVEGSVPNCIVIGQFDEAGIKANVTYEDDTTAEIDVTTEMIPETFQGLLETPGIYQISIMFRGAKTELTVRMVNSTNLYQVKFYNAKNQLISTQFVYDGESATLPSDQMKAVDGYAFVRWDRSHENISEDTNIYGLYVNVENTLSESWMKNALINAESYYNTASHFTSVDDSNVLTEGTETSTAFINYHYNKENKLATSQAVHYLNNSKVIEELTENEIETLSTSVSEPVRYGNYDKKTYQELFESMNNSDQPMTQQEFEEALTLIKLYGGINRGMLPIAELLNADNFAISHEVEYGYELDSNRLIYTCTIKFVDHNTEGTTLNGSYIIKYDDEKILQILKGCKILDNAQTVLSTRNIKFNFDYVEQPFEDLIPNFGDVNLDGEINLRDVVSLSRYLAGEEVYNNKQEVCADVTLDGAVDNFDLRILTCYIAEWDINLPFEHILGDVDNDGNISIGDVIFIMQYLEGTREFTDTELLVADVNTDDSVDEFDVKVLRWYLAKGDNVTLPLAYKCGDVNSDGKIDLRDVVSLSRYLAGEEVYNNKQKVCADVNLNDAVDKFDLQILSCYVAEWDVNVPFERTLGDVDNDKVINDEDIAKIEEHLNGLEFTDAELLTADVNIDGSVDEFDVKVLRCYLAEGEGITLPFAYKCGDVNPDDKINLHDVVSLSRYLAGKEVYNNKQKVCADVNLDDAVDKFDLQILSCYVAEWDVNVPFERTLGDVNNDGDIDTADIIKIEEYINGRVELTDTELLTADVNTDGSVDKFDVKVLRCYLAGDYDIALPFTYKSGDVNLDGEINSYDVTSLTEHLAGNEVYNGKQEVCADLNLDGNVDNLDLEILTSHVEEGNTNASGDVNNDGRINIKDIIMISQYLEGIEELTDAELLIADVNTDGSVNEFDVKVLRCYVVGGYGVTLPFAYKCGDVDLDGKVDTVDSGMITRYLAGEYDLTPTQLLLADVNIDDEVTEFDATLIQKFAVKKIECLPFAYGCGDVNLDGEVNSYDVTSLTEHLAGSEVYNAKQEVCADLNLDGVVDNLDLEILTSHVGEVSINTPGDVNNDGCINLKDIIMISQYLEGIEELTATELLIADVNTDGSVDEFDVKVLRCYLAGDYDITLPFAHKCGDVNLDGEINLRDVVSLSKYLASEEVYDNKQEVCADINIDGSVDNFDLQILSCYVAEWDIKIPFAHTLGDVDNDGDISIGDVIFIMQHLEGTREFTDTELIVADVNTDDNVDEFDVKVLRCYLVGGYDISLPFAHKCGDVNFDGEVNSHDVTNLSRYLAGEEVYNGKQEVCADINIDGTVDSFDWQILFHYVGGWTIEIPFAHTLGDVDNDGDISIGDVVFIMQHLEGIRELTATELLIANVNIDDKVDEFDVKVLRCYLAGGYDISLPFAYKCADVNNDGDISVKDTIMIRQHLNGIRELTNYEFVIADVNIDGDVDEFDINVIKYFILGKVTLPFAHKCGDVNLDGEINSHDVTNLSKYLADNEGYNGKHEVCADVNVDGTVDNFDFQILFHYVGGWTIEIPFAHILGDVNDDGVIDIGDATKIEEYINGSVELTATQLLTADVNSDTYVNEFDVKVLRCYLAEEYGIALPFAYNCGDVNQDGKVNTVDGGMITQYLAGEYELTPTQLLLADVNVDDEVTEFDATLIQKFAVRKIECLPFTEKAIKEMLVEIMNRDMTGEITMTATGKWNDDEGEARTSTLAIDYVNEIAKSGTDSEPVYIWETENVVYQASTTDATTECYKTTGVTFGEYMNAETIFFFYGESMLNASSDSERTYGEASINIVGDNFVMSIAVSRNDMPDIQGVVTFTFNSNHILSVESTYDYSGTYTYDYSDIQLELPAEIMALENSAVEATF